MNALTAARTVRIDRTITANAPLLLSVHEERGETFVQRTMTLGDRTVDFRVEGSVLPPALETSDFAVIASIFTAMRLRQPLHVEGRVSRALLANLEDFQAAWQAWMPAQYAAVRITADEEIAAPPTPIGRSVVAFSGGVDSTYSMLLHATGQAGRRTSPPAAGVLIHGLDISLQERTAFAIAEASARMTLDSIDVPLSTVRTNWRAALCHNWRMEHMAGIAAALNQFGGVADIAIVGSDEGYEKIDLPWGSNYITNPLLSGAMAFRTEGGDRTRTERIDFISRNSGMASSLRVCWENSRTGTNCGVCEKCISTQLNFRALGLEPAGFAQIASPLRVALTPIRSLGDLYFLRESQLAARRRGIRDIWRVAASVAIARHVLARPVLIALDAIKAMIRRNENLYRRLRKAGERNKND
jgi:hypothetical protein